MYLFSDHKNIQYIFHLYERRLYIKIVPRQDVRQQIRKIKLSLLSIDVPVTLWKLDLAGRLEYLLQSGHVLNLLLQLLESR